MMMHRRRLLASGAALAGLLTPLGAFAQSWTGTYRLTDGPMLGAVHPDRASFFTRASAPVAVQIEYALSEDFSDARRSAPVTPTAAGDYVARIEVEGLTPATTYHYRPVVNGKVDPYVGDLPPARFRTAPAAGAKGRTRIAFGSCARIQAHPVQPIWDAVREWRPDLFLWLGDNVYHDTLEGPIMADMYRWQRRVPNLQPLLRNVPQLAIWDDHDFALNDSDRRNPVKDIGLEVFKRYWANPSHGLPDAPGCFFKYGYGDLDLFMTDGRYHRDPNDAPDTPEKTILGKRQFEWLTTELKRSKATFKVIACGSGWSGAKGPGGDSWSAFPHERARLFDFIRDEKIEGVVLLSGDTHVGELNCIPWSEKGGYDLYDLVSSPLAQDPKPTYLGRDAEVRIRQPYQGSVNFGALVVDTTGPEPTLTYDLMTAQVGRAWDTLTLKASDLRNGVRSWDRVIDRASKARRKAEAEGKGYFDMPL